MKHSHKLLYLKEFNSGAPFFDVGREKYFGQKLIFASFANHYHSDLPHSLHITTQSKSSDLKILGVWDWLINVQININSFS